MSGHWKTRAAAVLAGGPATYSKHWQRYPANAPLLLMSGSGCSVTTPDGHTYLDTVAALGPILLGYNHPGVNNAVLAAVNMGPSFSTCTRLEIEVAEQLVRSVPGAEQVRFCVNGSDATNAAIRLARAVTGKAHVIVSGYSGFADWYIASTDKSRGILPGVGDFTHQIPWGDGVRLQDVLHDYNAKFSATDQTAVSDHLAAILVEVPSRPWGEDPQEITNWLNVYRGTAHDRGALFILDEVVTGLRYGLGGAQALYGVEADLVCLSKGLGNGYPIAALLGKRALMQEFGTGAPFMSSTFAGNTIGLAAAQATLEACTTTGALATLRHYGHLLGSGLAALLRAYQLPGVLWGNFARMAVVWSEVLGVATAAQLKTLWMQEMVRRGILIGPGVLFPMCCYHATIVQGILAAAEETCALMAACLGNMDVVSSLESPVLHDVFQVRA